LLRVSGLVQGDDTFAVPAATGCGPNGDGSLNGLVNAAVGLPSPSGANHLVLNDASSLLALPGSRFSGSGTPITRQEFAADWHIAFGNPTCTTTTTTTTTSTTATTTTTSAPSTTSTTAASTTTTTSSTTSTSAATTTTTGGATTTTTGGAT